MDSTLPSNIDKLDNSWTPWKEDSGMRMYYSNLEPSWIKKGLNPKQITTTFDQHLSEKNHEYFFKISK